MGCKIFLGGSLKIFFKYCFRLGNKAGLDVCVVRYGC